jgi:uncharacterized lipoprotein
MRNSVALSLLFIALAGCDSESKKQTEIEALSHKAATESRYKPTENPLDWTQLHKGSGGKDESKP